METPGDFVTVFLRGTVLGDMIGLPTSTKRKGAGSAVCSDNPKKVKKSDEAFRAALAQDPKRAWKITAAQAEVARDDYTVALVQRAKDAMAEGTTGSKTPLVDEMCCSATGAAGDAIHALRQYGLHLRMAEHFEAYEDEEHGVFGYTDWSDFHSFEWKACVDVLVGAGLYPAPQTEDDYEKLFQAGKYADTFLGSLLMAQSREGCGDATREFLKTQGNGFKLPGRPRDAGSAVDLDTLQQQYAVLEARVKVARDARTHALLRRARDRDRAKRELWEQQDTHDEEFVSPDDDTLTTEVESHLFAAYGTFTFPDVRQTAWLGDDRRNWGSHISHNEEEILDALVEVGFYPKPQMAGEWSALMQQHFPRVDSLVGCLAHMLVVHEKDADAARQVLRRTQGW
jgi:hypothetical protein